MLSSLSIARVSSATMTSLALFAAIVMGSTMGYAHESTGNWLGNQVDYTLLALVSFLFFGLRFDALFKALKSVRFLLLALFANFVLLPIIGYGIASLFLSEHPLFVVGLVIYFMSPCTDWFLSFTRISCGNVALGAALIPLNMTVQLLLYPLFIQWFTHNTVQVEAGTVVETLEQWFLLPLVIAIALQQLLRLLLSAKGFAQVLDLVDRATPWLTALLVLQIFAGNIAVVLSHLTVFAWVLLAVFTFFLLTFLLSEGLSYCLRLAYPEHALFTMTIAARNAPLMLAVTMAALPDQPLIYAALVLGMLVEFPHLTLLSRILLARCHSVSKTSQPNKVAHEGVGLS